MNKSCSYNLNCSYPFCDGVNCDLTSDSRRELEAKKEAEEKKKEGGLNE